MKESFELIEKHVIAEKARIAKEGKMLQRSLSRLMLSEEEEAKLMQKK